MNKYFAIALIFCSILIPVELFLSVYLLAGVTIGLAVVVLLALYLCKKQKHQQAWILALSFVTIFVTFSPIIVSPVYFSVLYLLNFFIVNIFLFDKKSTVNIYLGIYLCAMIIFATLSLKIESIETIANPILFNSLTIVINTIIAFTIVQFYLKEKTKNLKEVQYNLSLIKATLDSTMNGIVVINQAGEVNNFNQRFISLWNVPDRLWQNCNADILYDFMGEQLDNPAKLLQDKNLYAENTVNTVVFDELALKNGRIFEYHSHPQILNGHLVGRVITFRDISESRKAQRLLEQSESRFKTIFQHSPIGIVLGENPRKPMEHVNAKFCKMLGYTEEELTKLQVNDITFLKDRNIQNEQKQESLNGNGNTFSLRKRYIKKSGELIWANVQVAVIKDDLGNYKGDIVLVEDISEKIEQEEKIESLLQQLRESNEILEEEVQKRTQALQKTNTELLRSNEDLEQFAYVASHDLQEPLRMVGNFVQLLEKQYNDQLDEEGKSYINFAVDGVSRMSDLIHNLLKYSRVGKKDIAFRKTNIRDLVELKLYDLSQRIKETQTHINFPDKDCHLFCEPNQIGIVLYNLLNNALKFNQKEHKEINLNWEEKEEEWLFQVKDNGIGIDEQYKNKVFEIFKRLNRREDYEGTGIGLALCKKIINRHKGKIWFESTPGEGTTFYFTIHKALQDELQLQSHSNSASRG